MGLTRPRAHQLQDLDFKASCRVITTTNITLSGGAPATVDGVSLSAQDRVLVTGQSTGSENGLYRVTTVGTGSDGTWVRSADADATGDITAGMTVMVTEGSTYADTSWKLTTNDPITVGTTALTFEQFGGGGSGDPAGSDTQVQFNDDGSFAGDAGLTYNKTTDALTVTGNITGGNLITAGSLSLGGTIVTSTATELNKLDGYTGGVTELNYLDTLHATGVTDTEFDYLDGVTSNVQTQLDAKVAKTGSTGSAVLPTGTVAQRDGSPSTGFIRFNTDINSFEGYNGTSWSSVGGGATGAGGDAVFQENDLIVTTDYTITSGKSASSVGPITINSGVTVTVPSGSRWVVL